MKKHFISFLVVIAVFISLFCGKKGPIMPPIKKIPQEVKIQEVFQRGDKIIVEWKNPQSYLDGSALTEISKADIWIYQKPYEKESEQVVDPKVFKKQAVLYQSIQSPDFPEFIETDDKESPVYRYEITIKPPDYGNTLFFLGIRVVDHKGKKSEIPKPIAVQARIVPCSPSGLKAQAELKSVKLEWESPEKNTDGSSPACVKGYNLYRSSNESHFNLINDELIKETNYEDEGIIFGEEYEYFVRSSASEEPPFLESENSESVSVTVKDTIPPDAPEDLIIIAVHDRITLTWNRVKDNDLKGYKVWRRIKGDEKFILLTSECIKENIFYDFSVKKGIEYEYCVSACDNADNESERSEIITGVLKGSLP
ncbi:MAG: fibronectin type III domain-containing protein [Candidatus Aminicenantes bacterium]